MICANLFIHALSPLHIGIGQTDDIIDLPIARMQSTGIPILPGSSIKGVLRDACAQTAPPHEVHAAFGPDTDSASDHAGAVTFGDARLLCLPVRSFYGTFAYVTSPLLLQLAARDLKTCQSEPPKTIPVFQSSTTGFVCDGTSLTEKNKNIVYLVELDINVKPDENTKQWASFLAEKIFETSEEKNSFTKRFVVVHDEIMTFLWETATQVDTRVRLDSKTRTVATGALWMEESLPPETLLIGITSIGKARDRKTNWDENQVRDFVFGNTGIRIAQFGGKSTVGRGLCRVKLQGGGVQ